jgi:hypothetical protein
MIYPWRPQKLEITKADCQKCLGVSPDAGQEILQKLTQGCTLVDEANHCCLTDNSYLLPQSSELFKEFNELSKTQKGNNTKTRKKAQPFTQNQSISGNAKGATMNISSGNNTPYQDAGIGLARSVASSAPVVSLLPSSSYLTSGSGLNTPELGNDIDQNQTNTSNENSHKKDGVGKMLVQLLTSDGEVNDSGVLSVLRKKKREICVQTGSKYFVCNPILTPNMMEQIIVFTI